MLCHHPYCLSSQSQTLFGIGLRGEVLQPEVRPFTFSSQTGKTVDTCNISVTFILIRPITAKIRTTTILGDPGAVTRGYGPIDLHESRPLISLDPITCTTYCFRDRGIVMSPSLLFVQPITNLVWNRAPGRSSSAGSETFYLFQSNWQNRGHL